VEAARHAHSASAHSGAAAPSPPSCSDDEALTRGALGELTATGLFQLIGSAAAVTGAGAAVGANSLGLTALSERRRRRAAGRERAFFACPDALCARFFSSWSDSCIAPRLSR
jgi:hypothetical protein